MQKNLIWVGVIVLVLVGGALYMSGSSKEEMVLNNIDTTTSNEVAMEKKEMPASSLVTDQAMPVKNDMMEKDSMDKPVVEETSAGSYEAYSSEKLARAENGDVVLFFHASWCPSCRGLNADIEKNIGSIPAGVTILKTDYDTQTELKKKYGVTYQHTLVQVDKDGNMLKKWSGSSSLAKLLSQIQ